MANEEKILQLLESLVKDMAELKKEVAEIKAVQHRHGIKLDLIEKAINLQIDHSVKLSERIDVLERVAM